MFEFAFLLILSTPLMLAALGEVIGQRSGVINIGLEGMILLGAFTGFALVMATGSLFVALLAAAAVGVGTALLSGWFTIKQGSDQVVVGTAINLFALGATGIGFRSMVEHSASNQRLPELAKILGVDWVVLATLLLIPLVWFLMARTRWGLALRACGEYPAAVEAAGFSVVKQRLTAALIGGALAGVAGAHLSLSVAGSFAENMTAGRGFLAIALVTFGRWQPHWAALTALLLGYTQSLQYSLQGRSILGVVVPSQLWLALPYVLALVVLVMVGSGSATPRALGRPYERTE